MSEQQSDKQRTLSYRAVVIGIAGMVALAVWVHFHEVLAPKPGILAENSPPSGAVGVFIGVLLVGALIARLRRNLRLHAGELVVIYTMLIISAPIMTQGMWHRFLGLTTAIPREKVNLVLVDSYSDKLWPHGKYLLADPTFENGLPTGASAAPAERVRNVDVELCQVGAVSGIELRNPPATDDEEELEDVVLRIPVLRTVDGNEQLVPGERYLIHALFRLEEMTSTSRVDLELVSDGGETVQVASLRRNSPPTFSAVGGFVRTGDPYVSVPRDLDSKVELVFTLEGAGRVTITDVKVCSSEAIARMYKGSSEIRESDLPRLDANSRDSLLVRPDDLASAEGVLYTLKGSIPYRQWLGPLAYWLSIVLAVFLCLLGIGIIFRRQWADNERFSFPLVVLPRLLIEQKDEDGKLVRPLFRKRMFRVGVILAVVYSIMQGVAYYVPGMPDPTVQVNMAEYFASPSIKALVNGMAGSQFAIVWAFVAIAFFVDLEMLASILIFFWVCKIPYYFGEVMGWKTIKGPVDTFPFPHEQHIGAFLGLAGIVLWVSRRHLLGVLKRILGKADGIDDSMEAMSYRAAALMIFLSLVFVALWGSMTGLGVASSLFFFGFLIVCGLSAARIRTECGAPFTYFTPYYPYLLFYLLGGLNIFPPQTMVLAFCAGGFMAVAQFLMFAPSQVEMLHLGNQFQASPKGVKWGLILGIVGGVLLGGYVMLVWAYGVGGDNIPYMKDWALGQNWYFNPLRDSIAEADGIARAAAQGTQQVTASAYQQPGPVTAVGVGLGVTVLLTILRARFVGFWLHPIGYVLANGFFAYMCWGSLLVAWVVKFLALKIGGPRLIRNQLTPMFVGIFCGCILGMVFWDLIALIGLANGMTDVFTPFP